MAERYFVSELILGCSIITFSAITIYYFNVALHMISDWDHKINLLKRKGFERYLDQRTTFNDLYIWCRESDGKKIPESLIVTKSYLELKMIIWEELNES